MFSHDQLATATLVSSFIIFVVNFISNLNNTNLPDVCAHIFELKLGVTISGITGVKIT